MVATAVDLVDQANDSEIPGVESGLQMFAPVGQEFVPSLGEVDFVELFLLNWSSGPGSVRVELRTGSSSGALLGSSYETEVPGDHYGTVRCAFPQAVSLEPGAMHVFLVEELSQSGIYLLGTEDLYPLGQLILWGDPQWREDAWFREGVVTTGTPEAASTWSLIKNLYR